MDLRWITRMFDAIAVIDHNIERRNRLYQVLTDLNYQVTTIPSHSELIEWLKRERPRCVILAADGSNGSPDFPLALQHLRDIDKQLKIIALVPPQRLEELSAAAAEDQRLTVLNGELDHVVLIRSLLGVLKEREMERVDDRAPLKGHVLIVEDDPRIAQLFTEYLQRRGYTLTIAANGEEALLQMQVHRPKIVILDILLPGMDGLLTLRRIKALDPSVSVIVSSGFEDASLIEQATALGACAYLIKPFNLSKLEAAILTSTLQQPLTS